MPNMHFKPYHVFLEAGYDLLVLFWFVLLVRGSRDSARCDLMPKTWMSKFSQWMSEPPGCSACQYFSPTEAVGVDSA